MALTSIRRIAQEAFAARCIEDKLEFMQMLARALSDRVILDQPAHDRAPSHETGVGPRTDADAECAHRLGQNDALWASTERLPAYPEKLVLVAPQHVGRRRLGSARGRAELLHAIAHIEWHAIHLAIDAALRFEAMPRQFMLDWLGVAVEEARHFSMLNRHLRIAYACEYGDYSAHAGMWDMARKTEHDVVARMALVPRVLEARGLDVTPAMVQALAQKGDSAAAACLSVILEEEVRHVWLGTYWYRQACMLEGLDAESHFFRLLDHFQRPKPKGPLNRAARKQAGFSERELDQLAELVDPGAGKKSTGVIS